MPTGGSFESNYQKRRGKATKTRLVLTVSQPQLSSDAAAADSVILRGKSERENIISFAKDSLMCVKGSNQSSRAHQGRPESHYTAELASFKGGRSVCGLFWVLR